MEERPHFQRRPKGGPFAPSPRAPISPLLIIVLLGIGAVFFLSHRFGVKATDVTWNGFWRELEAGNVELVNLRGNVVTGQFKNLPLSEGDFGGPASVVNGQESPLSELLPNPLFRDPKATGWTLKKIEPKKGTPYYEVLDQKSKKSTGLMIYQRFTCEIPPLAFSDQNIDEQIRSKVATYTSTTPTDNTGYFMLFSILLTVGFLFVFWRMMRRTNEQMMGGGLQGFTKSPMRRYDPNGKSVKFKDVTGLENVKKELVEIVDFLKSPEKYHKMGARVPKGTLLFGPPGTGNRFYPQAIRHTAWLFRAVDLR